MIGSIVPILIRRQTQAMWRQSMLTISIISIGVAVMILLGSLVNALADKMLMLGIAARPHAQILALAHEDGGSTAARSTAPAAPTIPHWRSLIETIEHGIPDAKAAGMVIGVGDVRIGSHREAVTISGIDPQRHPDIIALPSWTLRGSPWAMDQASVLIGVSLAKRLGVDVGDDLIVAAGDRRGSTLRIVAVLSSGFQVVDDGQVFIEMSTASEMLGLAGQATDIAIRFADPLQAAGWADRLRAWSGNRVRVWSDDNRQAEVGLLVQSAIAWTIRVAMAIAIAVSITSITSLAIISRQREIGILKAIGASTPEIALVFIGQALIYCLLGIGGGIVLALILRVLLGAIEIPAGAGAGTEPLLPMRMGLWTLAAPCLTVLGIACAAAALPARRTARIQPIDAIRGLS